MIVIDVKMEKAEAPAGDKKKECIANIKKILAGALGGWERDVVKLWYCSIGRRCPD